jgi:hypothetical protein
MRVTIVTVVAYMFHLLVLLLMMISIVRLRIVNKNNTNNHKPLEPTSSGNPLLHKLPSFNKLIICCTKSTGKYDACGRISVRINSIISQSIYSCLVRSSGDAGVSRNLKSDLKRSDFQPNRLSKTYDL